MASFDRWRSACLTGIALGVALAACSRSPSAPSTTSTPARTLSSIQVGAAGNASASLQPGQTLQLWALAKYSDSTATDVTNLATWQSSNPALATVSSEGLLRAAAEGEVDVLATYQSTPGALHAVIRRAGCDASTMSPTSLTYNAFGQYSGYVTITTPLSDCYWTAASDASWLKFRFDPGRSGSGEFQYTVPPNNYPEPRTAHIIVSLTGGATLTHIVYQDKPVSCSYVVNPAQATFTKAGGSGSFDVVTTPANCQWTANSEYADYYGVRITAGGRGTGAGRVAYTVAPNASRSYEADVTIQVAGLSGANPPGTHTIHLNLLAR